MSREGNYKLNNIRAINRRERKKENIRGSAKSIEDTIATKQRKETEECRRN